MDFKDLELQLFAEDAGEQTEPETPSKGEEKPVPDEPKMFTQEQVDQMIAARVAREKAKSEKAAKEKAAEAAEAEKLKTMSEAERTAKRIEDLEKQVQAFQSEKTQASMMGAAREELRTRGYAFSDALVSKLIGADAEKTKAAIDDFVREFDKAVEKAVQTRVPSTTPKTGAKKAATLSKKDILAVKNKAERQQLIRQNMHLFK